MDRICINGRDELIVLELNNIGCFQADANYTTVYYLSGLTTTISLSLGKVEQIIASVPKSKHCDFVRVGRSLIVNQGYLYQILTLRQKIVLSNGEKLLSVSVNKEALKRYKLYFIEKNRSKSK